MNFTPETRKSAVRKVLEELVTETTNLNQGIHTHQHLRIQSSAYSGPRIDVAFEEAEAKINNLFVSNKKS